MNTSKVRKPGFALVELVIVVAIIGVIAAIAVPRISRGSKGAAEAALRANLQALRTAIDLHAADHGGECPATPATTTNQATFIGQLTTKTNAAGVAGTTPGVHIFGPYLNSIPPISVGPNVGASGIDVNNNATRVVYENKTKLGWVYSHPKCELFANTDDPDANGSGYDTY